MAVLINIRFLKYLSTPTFNAKGDDKVVVFLSHSSHSSLYFYSTSTGTTRTVKRGPYPSVVIALSLSSFSSQHVQSRYSSRLLLFFFTFSLFFLISRLLTLVLPPLSRRREHVSRKLDTPFVFLNWNPLYIYICMEECAPGSRWLPPHRRHHHHHYHRQQHLYPSHPPVCLLYRYNPTQNFLIPSFSQ